MDAETQPRPESVPRGQAQGANSRAKALANRERVLAAAVAARDAGLRPTVRQLAARIGIGYGSCYRQSAELKAEGRWPFPEADETSIGPTVDRETAVGMVSDPEAVQIAMRAARRAARRHPRLADEYESVAWAALWEIALAYRPDSRLPFHRYLRVQMRRAMSDFGRRWNGAGSRRATYNYAATLSLDDELSPEAFWADELPVGWEVESQDAVESITAMVHGESRDVLRMLYMECSEGREEAAGRAGVSRSGILRHYRDALRAIRSKMGAPRRETRGRPPMWAAT